MNLEGGFVLKSNHNKAILLLHGLTGSPFEMRWLGGKLHKKGFDVYCPVLPGHCSTLKALKRTKWEHWYDESKKITKELMELYDQEVYTVGLCIGGMIGVLLGKEFSLKGSITLSPILFLDGWTIPKTVHLLPIVLNTPLKHFVYFKEKEPYGIKNEFVRKRVSKMLTKNSVAYDRYPGIIIKELLRLSRQFRKSLAAIQTPTLIIQSSKDDLTSMKSGETIYREISSPFKRLLMLHDSYHLITIDNEKGIVLKEILNFLSDYDTKKEIVRFADVAFGM